MALPKPVLIFLLTIFFLFSRSNLASSLADLSLTTVLSFLSPESSSIVAFSTPSVTPTLQKCQYFLLKSYICYSNLWHHHKLPHTCLRLFPSTIIYIFPVYRWIHSTIRYMIRYRAIIQKLYICIFTSKGMVQTYKSYKIVNKISPLFNYSKHLLPHKKTLRGSIDILTY